MIFHTKMPYEVPNDVIMYHEKRIERNYLISACMPYRPTIRPQDADTYTNGQQNRLNSTGYHNDTRSDRVSRWPHRRINNEAYNRGAREQQPLTVGQIRRRGYTIGDVGDASPHQPKYNFFNIVSYICDGTAKSVIRAFLSFSKLISSIRHSDILYKQICIS